MQNAQYQTSRILSVPHRWIQINVGQCSSDGVEKPHQMGLWRVSVPQAHCGTLTTSSGWITEYLNV